MDNSDRVYLRVLEARISGLNKRIERIEKNMKFHRLRASRDEKEILTLKKQIEKIELEKEELQRVNHNQYHNTSFIQRLDSKSEQTNKDIDKVQEKIQKLQEAKKQLLTKRAQNKNKNEIIRLNNYLEKLKRKQCRISGTQRMIVMSKKVKNNIRERAFAKQEAHIDYYSNQLNDTTVLRNSLDMDAKGLRGIKNKILNSVYERKEQRLMKKKEKHVALLDNMQTKGTTIVGGRAMMIGKNALNRLRAGRDLVRRALANNLGMDEMSQAASRRI